MDQLDKELEKAQLLDKVVELLIPYYTSGKASEPIYLGTVENLYGADNKKLLRYLRDESDVFELTTELRVAMGRTEAQIFLTEDGEYLLKENGPWFVKRLTMERELDSVNAQAEELQQRKAGIEEQIAAEKLRLKERRERREKIFLWIAGGLGWLVVAIISFWDAKNSSDSNHLSKNAQDWDTERKAMQTEIDATNIKVNVLTKQLDAIPDSIKDQYIK